jgi:hypothetical protein
MRARDPFYYCRQLEKLIDAPTPPQSTHPHHSLHNCDKIYFIMLNLLRDIRISWYL